MWWKEKVARFQNQVFLMVFDRLHTSEVAVHGSEVAVHGSEASIPQGFLHDLRKEAFSFGGRKKLLSSGIKYS